MMQRRDAKLCAETLASPVGRLWVVTLGEAVCAVEFEGGEEHAARHVARWFPGLELVRRPVATRIRRAFADYFDGRLHAFDAIETLARGTPFQVRVWHELRKVAPGRTASYAEIARRVGRPAATRAVGLATGRNPVAIVIPCHRVIGRDGSLTGFGGGLPRKVWLLAHEGVRDASWPKTYGRATAQDQPRQRSQGQS
jgi:methylated-DNA-[protein]-cysteine S-methyltransferase